MPVSLRRLALISSVILTIIGCSGVGSGSGQLAGLEFEGPGSKLTVWGGTVEMTKQNRKLRKNDTYFVEFLDGDNVRFGTGKVSVKGTWAYVERDTNNAMVVDVVLGEPFGPGTITVQDDMKTASARVITSVAGSFPNSKNGCTKHKGQDYCPRDPKIQLATVEFPMTRR